MAKMLLLVPHSVVLVEIQHHLEYFSEKGDHCGLSAGSCRMRTMREVTIWKR